jgi:putative tricarboxylic transport membrane protein
VSRLKLSPEKAVLTALLAGSLLALLFMGQLIAPPKVLLGRMLTAISPSLFPTLIISALAAFSALVLLLSFAGDGHRSDPDAQKVSVDWSGVLRALLLFVCMLFYALSMVPLGFLISSCITLILISLLAGNRSILQIGILATLGPISLYLVATRILAVSLPELNAIELFYAQTLGL